MQNFIKYFLPYDLNLELHLLGFNEPCMGYFKSWKDKENIFFLSPVNREFIESVHNSPHETNDKFVPRATFEQAFEWFRTKYDILIQPEIPNQFPYITEDDNFEQLYYGFKISDFDQYRGGKRNEIEDDGYDTYKEPTESRLACLKKLIEIYSAKK